MQEINHYLNGLLHSSIHGSSPNTGFFDEIKGLNSILEQLYTVMLPLCSLLIGVGRGIAGFAATRYLAVRIWMHIANAELIDFYPLFRPFALGFAVLIFPLLWP